MDPLDTFWEVSGTLRPPSPRDVGAVGVASIQTAARLFRGALWWDA